MSERDELIARLRILDADDRRLPFHDMRLAAANLLERDGVRIAELEAEVTRLTKEVDTEGEKE